MTERLTCPACGSHEFQEYRTAEYEEVCLVTMNIYGEELTSKVVRQEWDGVESVHEYRCEECGFQPKDMIESMNPKERKTETVKVDGEQRGLPRFVEKLTGCTGILPAGYCSDLDLPQGSTIGDAVAKLAKEMGK